MKEELRVSEEKLEKKVSELEGIRKKAFFEGYEYGVYDEGLNARGLTEHSSSGVEECYKQFLKEMDNNEKRK